MFRYCPRIWRFEWCSEYSSASFASSILRSIVFFGWEMQRLRTSCWVIVEPPSTASPASRSATPARRMPSVSRPPCW
ncbi:MAG: hypothetical protein BGO11_13805 [Solirubrobacterales bacterium 70-9]|nr:MAG: hypothetical protein BGO11_13805 [Solirubrobacterales bacterium 70-9]